MTGLRFCDFAILRFCDFAILRFCDFAILRFCDFARAGLDSGFWLEEAAETRARELDTYQALAGLSVAYVDYATLGGEVGFFFFAAGTEMGLRDPNFQVGTDGYVKAGDKCSAAAAEVFAGSFFFEIGAAGVASPDFERQADGDSTFRARFRD
jgi:hypothetical protein